MLVSLPERSLLSAMSAERMDHDFVLWDMAGPQPEGVIDLAVMPYMAPASALRNVTWPYVKAVQSQALGYDGVSAVLDPRIAFANAKGVHEQTTAEHALALILAQQRMLPRAFEQQQCGEWAQWWSPGLSGNRVIVIGVGGVGGPIATVLAVLGADVTRVGRREREDESGHVYSIDALPQLAKSADILVAALPGGAETEKLIDNEVLAALPDSSLVVNIGRGSTLDIDALLEALEAGRLRAALDVTDPEPLPEKHPLWQAPGVLLTPHFAGRTAAMGPRIRKLIVEQIDRLNAGSELANRIRFAVPADAPS